MGDDCANIEENLDGDALRVARLDGAERVEPCEPDLFALVVDSHTSTTRVFLAQGGTVFTSITVQYSS